MTRALGLVVVAVAALSWVLPGASAIAQETTDSFVSGIDKFQRGEYDEAAVDLAKAVQEHPDAEAAWYYLGATQFEMVFQNLAGITESGARDYSEAQKSLLKARDLAPSRPGIRMYLGRIAEDKGSFDEAARFYHEELSARSLVERDPVYVALARIAYKTGKYADASNLLQKVLIEEPTYVEAIYYVGLTKAAGQDYAGAIKSFKLAIKILNDWLDAINRILRINYLETDPDDPEKVSKVLDNWHELRKELWALRSAKARPPKDTIEQVSEKYRRAQQFALDLHMWPELNKALGDAYLGTKDWAGARNQYRRAMEPREGDGSKTDPDAWRRIGDAYFLNGKAMLDETGLLLSAIEQFKAAEGDQATPSTTVPAPTDPTELLDGYARALHAVGISKSAKLDQMKAPPEPELSIARIFDGLGELYLFEADTYSSDPARDIKSHTHDEAVEAFDKALLYSATYVPAMLHKAQATLSRGDRAAKEADKLADFGKARDLLEQQALALEPNNAALWAELARAYVGLDDMTKADGAAKKALLIDKKNLLALNMSGLVKYYPPKHDCIGAADDFNRAIQIAPKDFQSFVNLGNALYGLQSWGIAQGEYYHALSLIPKSSIANTGSQRPYILYLIALTQHELKHYEPAIATLGSALEIRPDFYDALRLLAASYSGLSEWKAAEEALRSALKSVPADSVQKLAATHAHLGQLAEVQGRLHEAYAEYRTALSQYPGNIEAADGLKRLAWQEKTTKQPKATP